MSDGQWHDVRAQFNPAYMEVAVDGEKKSMRPRVGDNKHIDLSGLLYFGGIEPGSKKQRAVDQGNKDMTYHFYLSSEVPFLKCIYKWFSICSHVYLRLIIPNK